jgi:hypothetical protein
MSKLRLAGWLRADGRRLSPVSGVRRWYSSHSPRTICSPLKLFVRAAGTTRPPQGWTVAKMVYGFRALVGWERNGDVTRVLWLSRHPVGQPCNEYRLFAASTEALWFVSSVRRRNRLPGCGGFFGSACLLGRTVCRPGVQSTKQKPRSGFEAVGWGRGIPNRCFWEYRSRAFG